MRVFAVIAVRLGQFVCGFMLGYAASYGLQVHNQALITAGVLTLLVSILASAFDKRFFAGLWAVLLGMTAPLLFSIPRLTWPECPAAGDCVSPGTHLATIVATVVALFAVAWGARSLRNIEA